MMIRHVKVVDISYGQMGGGGGHSGKQPPGLNRFRSDRTFERVTTPGSVAPFDESQLPNSFHYTVQAFF